jgi:nicotinate-nucleotide adenylyltransferase
LSPAATGLLGGSFDPVHLGHLAMARIALERVGMGEVWFMPAARPPHKSDRALSDSHHRHAMLSLATLEQPRYRVSIEELERAGRSYTVDTLKRLRRAPGTRRRWCFLAGADAFAEIGTWRRPRSILDLAEFVVFPRNGIGFADLRRRLPAWVAERLVEHSASDPRLPGSTNGRPGVHWVPVEVPAVSSTEVRRRARRGEDLTSLVPALVAHYIERYGLYRARRGAA